MEYLDEVGVITMAPIPAWDRYIMTCTLSSALL
jgi:hypothetical protein